jgi:hypothetical protein
MLKQGQLLVASATTAAAEQPEVTVLQQCRGIAHLRRVEMLKTNPNMQHVFSSSIESTSA